MKLSDVNPTPLYDFTIPSTNARVKFRPFFVKEERAAEAPTEITALEVPPFSPAV